MFLQDRSNLLEMKNRLKFQLSSLFATYKWSEWQVKRMDGGQQKRDPLEHGRQKHTIPHSLFDRADALIRLHTCK